MRSPGNKIIHPKRLRLIKYPHQFLTTDEQRQYRKFEEEEAPQNDPDADVTHTMFSVLPNPPGQVGSNEFVGVLVFGGLLGFPKTSVLAMFLFSHPLAALIMTTMSLVCLSGLGISLTSVTKMNVQEKGKRSL